MGMYERKSFKKASENTSLPPQDVHVLQYVFHLEHTDIHVHVYVQSCTSVCTYSLTPWLDFLSSASGEVVFGEGARTGASDVNNFDLAFSLFKSRQLKIESNWRYVRCAPGPILAIVRYLGVMISLYCSFSTLVEAATLYGITMLLMSNALSVRLRREVLTSRRDASAQNVALRLRYR